MARRHTILVVDDEPDVVQSVQDLLRLDYKVLGATRATEGIKIMESVEVQVVISDQRMPEMTGVEFLRRVRDHHPDTLRLLITGYADIKAVIDAINQGSVYRYITKPWDPDELQTIIRQATQQYDLLIERKKLLGELKSKNQELEEANAELQQANQLKEAFIRVASHELRTPLTIMSGLTDLALRTPDCMTEGVRLWLTSASRACERLDRLVDQLTKMLTVGDFKRSLDAKPTDLAILVRQAAQEVRPFIDQRKQELAVDLAIDLGTIDLEALRTCYSTPSSSRPMAARSGSAPAGPRTAVLKFASAIPASELTRPIVPISSKRFLLGSMFRATHRAASSSTGAVWDWG